MKLNFRVNIKAKQINIILIFWLLFTAANNVITWLFHLEKILYELLDGFYQKPQNVIIGWN